MIIGIPLINRLFMYPIAMTTPGLRTGMVNACIFSVLAAV